MHERQSREKPEASVFVSESCAKKVKTKEICSVSAIMIMFEESFDEANWINAVFAYELQQLH